MKDFAGQSTKEYMLLKRRIFFCSITTVSYTHLIEKTDTGRVEAGETVEIAFSQKMVLQGGQHLLSLGCTGYEDDALVVYHRLYDICLLYTSRCV